MNKPSKATCPHCGKLFELNHNGKLPGHSEQWKTCKGSYTSLDNAEIDNLFWRWYLGENVYAG